MGVGGDRFLSLNGDDIGDDFGYSDDYAIG